MKIILKFIIQPLHGQQCRHTKKRARLPRRYSAQKKRRRKSAPLRFAICDRFQNYLLENWGARRAFLRPYFLRSLTRGSRVKKPAFLRAGRQSGSA